ncbi:MAG: hypothetical protein AAF065_13120 [Verrucomicrobiota bacterium]
MLPYLNILIRVEDDGSLHALGAFTSKEKQAAYQKATGLADNQVRLDFYNGPFDQDIKVVYAGHRRWNMDRFQLGGYFKNEGEAWNWVTREGYVSVLQIDTTFEAEQRLEKEALELYAKLQKRWRLTTYQDLIDREGADKARANITLRFYEDALESFKPKTRRDVRALYAFIVLVMLLPVAIYFYASSGPEYGENVPTVGWLPSYATDISFYRSNQVKVYEFRIKEEDFKIWAASRGMQVRNLENKEIISRYKAYIPTPEGESSEPVTPDGEVSLQQFQEWQGAISATIEIGIIARDESDALAVYDVKTQKAYFEHLIDF